ncbi:MAG: hypothetical protein H6867_01595 [Rhodospirillales bacterium]|nr:hypothetical protein [Rhodospirillales bacterium]MCB9997211.1 hypothetical protein [Rhodospirillales bacterium]
MHLKTGVLLIFMMAFAVSGPAIAAPDIGKEITQQQAPEPACTPVARAFDRTVCQEDITAEQSHIADIKQQYEDQGLDSEQAIRQRNLERLKDVLWAVALSKKFGEARFTPSAEEINTYNKVFKSSLARSHEENLQTATKIKDYLAHRTYSPEEEQKLKALLASVETSIAFYKVRLEQEQNMPPEFGQMITEAEHGIAETMIREWKINKALYETYGGRLVKLQGALIPVDAYQKFVGYIRKDGGLEILDPAYQSVFDGLASLPADSAAGMKDKAVAEKYFSSPFWQFEDGTAN